MKALDGFLLMVVFMMRKARHDRRKNVDPSLGAERRRATVSRHAVSAYMTPSPHTIAPERPLEEAHAMMRRYGIRHLPVLECGRLAGILSQRDLYLAESIPGFDPRFTRVEIAMTHDTFCVAPEARVEDVALEMAEQKYGCAVVMAHGRVRGIFTTTDALRALSDVGHVGGNASPGSKASGSNAG